MRRRSKPEMQELKARMLALEAQGIPRHVISERLCCTPRQVTYGLGARRRWRGRRVEVRET